MTSSWSSPGPAAGRLAMAVVDAAPAPDHTAGASVTTTSPSPSPAFGTLRSTRTTIAANATITTAYRSQPCHEVSRETSTHAHTASTATQAGSTSQVQPSGSRYFRNAHTAPAP